MTHPPKSSAPPPAGVGAPTPAAVPPQSGPGAGHGTPPGPHGLGPDGVGRPRRTAFAEGVDRVRAAATTEPGRLRVIGAVLAALVVAFGAVTAVQTGERADAADAVLHESQPLSLAAADIYRSLADANTAASSGFLAGGAESRATRERYEKDIRTAAAGLVDAAGSTDPDSPAATTIAELNRLLPEYKGLIEAARANNRLGYPLGGAYLRYANDTMQTRMLPAAEKLYTSQNRRLDDDYADATPYPWIAIGLGAAALTALGWAQHRTYRRTHRVLNPGMAAGTVATAVVLLWLVAGHTLARAGLNDSYDHAVRSLNVLNDARIASLKARGDENLTLVNRGAETVEVEPGRFRDKFDVAFEDSLKALADGLATAERLADDTSGARPVQAAGAGMEEWRVRHREARAADDAGDYQTALDRIIGTAEDKPTRECFDTVDHQLDMALRHERSEFRQAAGDGRAALTGLAVGAAGLAVLGAAGALLGIGRRLSEYR